jgi:acyl-CoA synthetase (AMP-forming)/AMP-acid ligase II
LAEATLIVAGARKGEGPVLRSDGDDVLVSSGTPLLDVEVRIADPETRAAQVDGDCGEIWIRGPNVAVGYWRKPALSEARFGATLAREAGSWFRTGDVGYQVDGELYVVGRLDDVIVIHGRTLYPEEVELSILASTQGLRPQGCAVIGGAAEALVVVVELAGRRGHDTDGIARAVVAAVERDHGMTPARVVLVPPLGLPRTSSGKLQRQLCRQLLEAGTLAIVAER